MKRIFLLLVTNLAVLAVLTIVAHLIGLDRWLALRGSSLGVLLAFAAVFGFGGALVSLLMSKWMARNAMGVRIIGQPATGSRRSAAPGGISASAEQWLVGVVARLARAAGIGMPEVGVFDSPQPNAFATGYNRDAALVAVSTGLLATMNEQEIEAVLGHELTHVANGDMVTLTLIQGVVNTFVIFLSRIIGNVVDRTLFRSDDGRGPAYFLSVLASQILLGILANMIVMAFSRWREFRADRGGAHLCGIPSMIAALEALKRAHEPLPSHQFASFGITSGSSPGSQLPRRRGAGLPGGIRRLFMSHPPLDERIAALRALKTA
ncbi:MAG TPA: protease HtpX [Steroidobacteraceae bacterium]|jgi:heat shock protein HtpX|nr:protease HtpX [Steroidobacteraceae bacterium]